MCNMKLGRYRESSKQVAICDLSILFGFMDLASAEILIMGLQRGDLDWRELIKPKKTLR